LRRRVTRAHSRDPGTTDSRPPTANPDWVTAGLARVAAVVAAPLAVPATGAVPVGIMVGWPAVGVGDGVVVQNGGRHVGDVVDGWVTGRVGKPGPLPRPPFAGQNGRFLLQVAVGVGVAEGLGFLGAAGTWFHFEPLKIGWRNDCTGRLDHADCA
jgi:hypothetical protein